MVMIYRYLKEQGLSKAPIILIKVTTITGNDILVPALIDSGADVCIIPRELAEDMGLKMTGIPKRTRGIGGVTTATETSIIISVEDKQETHKISLPAIILQDEVEYPFIIGRKGFFDNFHITFKQDVEELTLERVGHST